MIDGATGTTGTSIPSGNGTTTVTQGSTTAGLNVSQGTQTASSQLLARSRLDNWAQRGTPWIRTEQGL
jgi:hypothetical protein